MPKKKSLETKARALELHREGIPNEEIIERLNVSRATLYRWIGERTTQAEKLAEKIKNEPLAIVPKNPPKTEYESRARVENQTQTELETEITSETNTQLENWLNIAEETAFSIAKQNEILRFLIFNIIREQLESGGHDYKLITGYIKSLSELREGEWNAKGLSYLDLNYAAQKLKSLGYSLNDFIPTTVTENE